MSDKRFAQFARLWVMLLFAAAPLLPTVVCAQNQPQRAHEGMPIDWTSHHLLFTAPSSDEAAARNAAAAGDPRARYSSQVHGFSLTARNARYGHTHRRRRGKAKSQVDWSVSLGTGNVAPAMSPAKFTFDINATPSCTNDYVVFALNVPGTPGGQANVVGINNLYSGSGTSLCGASPTILFSYAINRVAGSILTSPILSLDGTKVAFVESTTTAAVLHVLTWHAGEGTSATSSVAPTNSCNLDLGPCSTCPSNASCDASLTINPTIGSTLSSPFVDYHADFLYVGTDDGTLYKITGIFYGTPTLAASPWPVLVSAGVLTSPVVRFGGFGNQTEEAIYLGDDTGNLFMVDPSLGTVSSTSTPVGGGFPGGGVVDSPIVDNTNNVIFGFSANDGTSAVVVEEDTSLNEVARGAIGTAVASLANPPVNVHLGMFDNNYFTSVGPPTGSLYVCGVSNANTNPVLYQFNFTASTTMTTPAAASKTLVATAGAECSPLTEIFNTNTSTDRLFVGLLGGCGSLPSPGCVRSYDVTAGTIPATFAVANESGGTSGIVVDNVSPAGQASSIYFSTLGTSKRAVKLTQAQLH